MSTTEIGPFVAGEKPGQYQHTFEDDDGVAINITGYTVKLHIQRVGASAVTRTGSVVNGAAGIGGYTLTATDIATDGIYKFMWEAGNGTNRYFSDPIISRVRPALVAGST